MPLKPDYFIARAEEVEAAARAVNDPVLRKAYDGLSRALRALAGMVQESNDRNQPPKNGDDGLPKRH
jgi:hypothetical protein